MRFFLCNAFVHHLNGTRTIEISSLIAAVVCVVVVVVVVCWCWYRCDCFVAFEIVTVPRVVPTFQLLCFLQSLSLSVSCTQLARAMMWFWRRWIACEFIKHLNGWHASKIHGNSMCIVWPIQKGQWERAISIERKSKKWINDWMNPDNIFYGWCINCSISLALSLDFLLVSFYSNEVDIDKYPNVCFGISFKWHVIWSYTVGMNLHLYSQHSRQKTLLWRTKQKVRKILFTFWQILDALSLSPHICRDSNRESIFSSHHSSSIFIFLPTCANGCIYMQWF